MDIPVAMPPAAYPMAQVDDPAQAECRALRAACAAQTRLIVQLLDRIDLLEGQHAPLGPVGKARLRRTPWLARLMLHVRQAVR